MRERLYQQKTVVVVAGLVVIMAFLLAATGCTQQAPPAVTIPPATSAPAATMIPQESAAPVAPGTTVQQMTAPTPEEKQMVTFTESDNGATKEIATRSSFAIQLSENPTTGYSWNASASPGLGILSSDYQENSHPEGMVGVGGTRTWVLSTDTAGTYTFTAVYKRSWEATTGNETGYNLTLNAVQR
jgi:inhibitor of cysteine peptidase